MSKVKANLMKVNLKAGNYKRACHLALQLNAEEGSVHTDSAYSDVKDSISPSQWAGYLAALKADGLYSPRNEGWGRVK